MAQYDFDLETFLPFRLHQASEAVSQSFRAVYRDEYGLTRNQWRVLAHLGQYGAMTATEIGKAAKLHKTKVSRAVFTLERRRWLIREQNTTDRRVQQINLTDQGMTAFKRLGHLGQLHNQQLQQKLGREQFQNLLKLLAVLESGNAK